MNSKFSTTLVILCLVTANFLMPFAFPLVHAQTPTLPSSLVDNDRDGFTSDVDCDDNDSSVNPGAAEYPNNEVDENCDGIVLFIDKDQDGFHSMVDCDDNNPNIRFYAYDIPGNGIDENCDGVDDPCSVLAGSISTSTGTRSVMICSGDNEPDVVCFTTTSTAPNFVYILVNASNQMVDFIQSKIDFEGSPSERCRVIGVAYTGNLLIKSGDDVTTTTIADGCAEVSNPVSIFIEDMNTCGIVDQRVITTTSEETIEKNTPQLPSSNKRKGQ